MIVCIMMILDNPIMISIMISHHDDGHYHLRNCEIMKIIMITMKITMILDNPIMISIMISHHDDGHYHLRNCEIMKIIMIIMMIIWVDVTPLNPLVGKQRVGEGVGHLLN